MEKTNLFIFFLFIIQFKYTQNLKPIGKAHKLMRWEAFGTFDERYVNLIETNALNWKLKGFSKVFPGYQVKGSVSGPEDLLHLFSIHLTHHNQPDTTITKVNRRFFNILNPILRKFYTIHVPKHEEGQGYIDSKYTSYKTIRSRKNR